MYHITRRMKNPKEQIAAPRSFPTGPNLFLAAILLQLCFFIYLILQHRFPVGHDGFQYFTLQYYFLNNAVFTGEVPQWMPFMTQGTVSTWWYAIQNSFLQGTLLLISPFIGSLLEKINFLSIFQIGIFVDELLLLTGTWLLGKRFFSSSLTVFFVTVSVMGSCIWLSQPWYNFHFYYAFPLILYYGHRFLDTGRWRYIFLAGNLLGLQIMGNLPYFLPILSLFIFLYFLFFILLNYRESWEQIKRLRWRWPAVSSLAAIIMILVSGYTLLRTGTDQIVNYNYGRLLDSTTSLAGFQSYALNLNFWKWLELLLGLSPALDYSLYIGFISLPLIIIGVFFNPRRQNGHFLLLILIILLFSVGSIISELFYHFWPMLKYYRHLALVSPFAKFLLCFLSGFGFEVLLTPNRKFIKRPVFIGTLIFCSFSLFCISGWLLYLSHHYQVAANLLTKLVEISTLALNPMTKQHEFIPGLPRLLVLFGEEILSDRLQNAFSFALIGALLMALSVYVLIRNKKFLGFLLGTILTFHLFDIYGYKVHESALRSVSLTQHLYKLTYFEEMPYSKRRSAFILDNNNPRTETLDLIDPMQALYWSTHSFLFVDEVGNSLRTDHWLWPLDRLMRAYWKQPLDELTLKPKGLLYYQKLIFPLGHPAAAELSGLMEDKIQFFSKAFAMNDDRRMAETISDSAYAGDILFVSDLPEVPQAASLQSWSGQLPLNADTQLSLPYEIRKFDANHLVLTIDVAQKDPAWLFYSDVWHPFWKATVNEKPTQIFRANLAYKAVALEPGTNTVHFKFSSGTFVLLSFLFNLNAMFWLGMVICHTGRLFKEF